MISRTHAYKLRELIVLAARSLTDENALDGMELFDRWAVGTLYAVGTRIRYGDDLYRVEQEHTSQADWTPDTTKALYTKVAKPGEIPEWVQPTGAQDAYRIGDKVRHNGKIWVCTVDYNVYEPGVYGWDEAE